jgi:hypothetical protein
MIKITIITPCSRPYNLDKIYESLNFDYIDEWIIVYDAKVVNPLQEKFKSNTYAHKIKEFIYTEDNCSWGNAQRNYGMSVVKNNDTYIYFLDDDNIIHSNLYNFLARVESPATDKDKKIYTFIQNNQGHFSTGDRLYVGGLDTALFLIHIDLCKDIKWDISRHEADAIFFLTCYNNNKDKHIYIEEELCYYNYLR